MSNPGNQGEPLPLDIPEALETKRLVLRCPRAGDGEKVHAAVVASLDALRRFPASLGWAMETPSLAASEAFCRSGFANFSARRDFPLLMLLRGTDTVVGSGGLHRVDWSVPKFEIGWWGRTGYTRQGLLTEGVVGILAFGFDILGARRIFALPDDENTASCRLCERVGMQLEGVLRNERAEPGGGLRHTKLYASIR
jgi:RimJ/RimL family protein N-acetyltransferase